MKLVLKFIASTATVLGLSLGLSGDAHAAGSGWGYVCNVTHYPMQSGMGSAGYVQFDLYSGVACAGSYVGTYYLMSAGNSYPGNANAYFTEAGQLAHYRNLVQSAYSNKKIYVYTPSAPNNFIANGMYFYNYN